MKTEYKHIPAYTTKDESMIRELMHPAVQGNSGQGDITLGDKTFTVQKGDIVFDKSGHQTLY